MSSLLGVFLGLASAIVWGSGDFFGGRAALKASQYQALLLTGVAGWLALLGLMLVFGESLPTGQNVMWALVAGLGGSLGLLSLYHGLSLGNSAIVAPTSAVTSAAVSVIYGSLRDGLPNPLKLLGFVLGLLGIWFVAQTSSSNSQNIGEDQVPPKKPSTSPLIFALLAGLGFGLFFVFIAQVESTAVFAPLVVSRLAIIVVAIGLLIIQRQAIPNPLRNPAGVVAGLFDVGGNVLFLFAKQYARFDVASVLSSLYPASTVLLSWLILKERLSKTQVLGLLICLAAVGLISI